MLARLRCWRNTRHKYTPDVEILQVIPDDRGVGVVARRSCACGAREATSFAVDVAPA